MRVKYTKPSEKNKKIQVEFYALSIYGLEYALLSKEAWEKIDLVVEKQKHLLPLIFGKWQFFEENGFKEFVADRLKIAVRRRIEKLTDIWVLFDSFGFEEKLSYREREKLRLKAFELLETAQKALGKKSTPAEEKLLKVKAQENEWNKLTDMNGAEEISDYALFAFEPGTEQVEDFLMSLQKDKELREFITAKFEQYEKEKENQLLKLRSWKKAWYKHLQNE